MMAAFLVVAAVTGGTVMASPIPPAAPAPAAPAITVSFKLDSRLTRGLYMGDRWVSPPRYSPGSQPGTSYTIDARAHRIGATGGRARIAPRWTPSDPDMVSVSPGEGHEVKITVQRAGESTIQVAWEGLSTTLAVKSAYQDGAIKVEVTRK
jgi:hypothetical protein